MRGDGRDTNGGIARTRWTLGAKPGDQTLAAAVVDEEARSALTVAVPETRRARK